MMMSQAAPRDSGRIKFIDGLRGVAVLLVVFFHFDYQQITEVGKYRVVPTLLQDIFRFGNMGVYIFFVISGFIVSFVTFDKVKDHAYILKFVLRRQIRLDPPFWLAVLLGLILAMLSVKVLHNDVYMPQAIDILTNITYTFGILDKYDIIRVGWTLCLEIQFYIVYILIIFTFNKLKVSEMGNSIILYLIFLLSLAASAFYRDPLHAYIVNYWYAFFLGVAVTFHIKGKLTDRLYFIILVTPLAFIFAGIQELPVLFAVSTSLLIFASIKMKRENKWLSGRVFQFFGLISYSLYLTHALIGNKMIRFLKRAFHWHPTDFVSTIMILSISVMVCTILGYIFFILIEKRSILWSKRLTTNIK